MRAFTARAPARFAHHDPTAAADHLLAVLLLCCSDFLSTECGYSAERAQLFAEMFGRCKSKLRAILGATGFALPQIVDSTWRLDYQLATSSTGRQRVPVYLVKLSTVEKDGTPSQIEFTCTLHQLQDFLGKTKDACKQLERILKPAGGRR